jgi:sugar O-acyltransferase (sialic acid O-acetyltransferase NeuD family)
MKIDSTKVVLFGNGQMAEIAHTYLSYDSPYEVVAFTVDKERANSDTFLGLPLIPFDKISNFFPPEENKMFVPISAKYVNTIREKKYFEAKAMGYQLISYISPRALVFPDVKIGDNCFIFENNVIQPFASIGNNCILWSGNHIGHHSSIGPSCFLASHVVVSGRVNIGKNCYFGVNSTVRDGINIAENCTVGAGALIMRDTENGQVYMGLPAKRISQKSDDVDIV